ncbi:MAG: Crp/Fnr family transcriptional regulator [Thiomonas sp.]
MTQGFDLPTLRVPKMGACSSSPSGISRNPQPHLRRSDLLKCPEEGFQRLLNTPVFVGWPADSLARLQAYCQCVCLDQGEVLFTEGSAGSAFYFVLSGRVLLSSDSASGQEKIVEIVQPGQLFALAVGLLGKRYPVTATCEGRCELIELPFATFLQILREQPELTWLMMGNLSIRLNFLVNEVRRMSVESADARVAEYLLDRCPHWDSPARVELPSTKAALAARLGIKPETLSRVFARLRRNGLADIGKLHIDIPDPKALQSWKNAR